MLKDALADAVKKLLQLASEKQLGSEVPSVEYQVCWMEPENESSSHGKTKIITRPSFRLLLKELGPSFSESAEKRALAKLAREFSSVEGKFCPFNSREFYISGQEDNLLEFYFQDIGLKFDSEKIEKTVHAFETDLKSDSEMVSVILQVQSFSADAPFDLGPGIKFRPITMDDVERYGTVGDHMIEMGHRRWLDLNDWICEMELPIEKASAAFMGNPLEKYSHNNLYFLTEQIGLVLALASPISTRLQQLYCGCTSIFLRRMWSYSGAQVRTSRLSQNKKLNKNGISNAQRLFRRLAEIYKHDEDLQMPLRRLKLAATRTEDADHLIDCVIGLENMLAPDKGESRYKFSVRGASLLPDNFGTPRDRFELLSKLYDKRSDVVHGRSDSLKDVAVWCDRAENILREVIKWYFEQLLIRKTREEIIKFLDEALIQGGQLLRASDSSK
jgi:hypothetical protein